MALPSDLTTITVTGTFTTITGTPLTGQVNFSLTTPVEDSTGKVIFNAFTQSAPLNSAGFMSIVLPCTDNADLNPVNFSYLVTEVIQGLGRAYYVQLPHTLGSTVDLSALAPVSTPPAPSAFATSNTWTGPQTFAGNPPVKIPGGAVAGDVLTSDASGNATWQAAAGGVQIAGDLGGSASSPQVVGTHLASPLPQAQGGLGNTSGIAVNISDTLDQVPAPAANVSLNSHKVTNLANGSASSDAAAFGQIPVIDVTATDIQPIGVQAAGVSGKTADAKHVHPYQPWQFLPESYGAKGDGKVVGDVSTTSGSKVIASVSAGFTSADVGKHVMIHGGNGTTSGPYIDVIASVNPGLNQATLTTNNAGATVSNCPMVYGSDDTSAIQSAVAAAGAYATANQYFAEVVFGAKIYILATGPTQVGNGTTTPTFNAQITLPYPAANGTSQKMVIALTGAGDAGYCQYWQSLIPNLAGSCLVSMISAPSTPDPTFGIRSVIGGPTGQAGFAANPTGYANVKAVVKGLSVWCPIYTNLYAYDFGYVSAMRVQQSSAHIFAPPGVNSSAVLPYLQSIGASAFTTSVGSGFRTPVTNNNDDIVMDDVCAEGYECAFRVFDHFVAGRLAAIYSDVVMYFNGAQGGSGVSHGIFVLSMSAEVYNVGFLTNGGTVQVNINWDAECTGVTADITDNSNALHGVFRFRDPADAGRGITVNGAAKLKIVNEELGPGLWASPPSVPATTVAQVNTAYRDATVYLTSGGAAVTVIKVDATTTGLTLGTTGTVAVRVPSGHSITLTYASTAPTWVWVLD